jgi:hypothetical protein
MNIKSNFLAPVFIGLFLVSCNKKPEACFTVSNSSPSFGEQITIQSDCSQNSKWADFFLDGEKISSELETFEYTCFNPGEHTLTMKAYSRTKGSSNSRTGCTNCSGSGKVSEYSQTINVSKYIAITSNSPVNYDETILLSPAVVSGGSYNWTGPNNFSSSSREVQISHATAGAAGVYSLVVSVGDHISATSTVQVNVQPVAATCSPANNQCTFTGGLTGGACSVSANVNNGQYELYVTGSAYYCILRFPQADAPSGGIYTITGNSFNIAPHEVYMKVHYNSFFQNTVIGGGKVYISVSGGKVSATFCSIPFTYMSNSFTVTGKVTEP